MAGWNFGWGGVDIHLTDVSTYIQLEITPSHLLFQLRLSEYIERLVLKCYNGILSCDKFYWEWRIKAMFVSQKGVMENNFLNGVTISPCLF